MRFTLRDKSLRIIPTPSLLAIGALWLNAGVVPHYALTSESAVFQYLEDPVKIECSYDAANKVLFADGTETMEAYTGPGFPIGFDFRYAGRTFDTFILTSNGSLILGNGGTVSFDGNPNFYTGGYGSTETPFYLGCVPAVYSAGDKKTTIGYSLDGEEGERILTVEYRKMKLNEIGSQGNGLYSTQLKLHESDGRIEMILNEEETAYSNAGFIVGLWGWDKNDVVLGTAKGLDGEFTKSPSKSANQLVGNTYVSWNPADFMKLKTRRYSFIPAAATGVGAKPVDLIPVQEGTDLNLTVLKSNDADATLVMMADHPFADGEYPQDGKSYPSEHLWHPEAAIGEAVVLYHGEEEEYTINIAGIEPGKSYYFRAISSDGYPNYSKEFLDLEYISTQDPPSLLTATLGADNAVSVECDAEGEVVIAMTTTPYPYYLEENPYIGDFGIPTADMSVNAEIEGGGKVIYRGAPGTVRTPLPAPNRPVYYRAWTIADGRISSTSTDTYLLPPPTIPYDPAIETWPISCIPEGWTAYGGGVSPDSRYMEPHQALRINVGSARPTEFISPELPMEGDMRITFDWSLESQEMRDAATLEAGRFGTKGYAALYLGIEGKEEECWKVTEYPGAMEVQPSGSVYAGSAEMIPVAITVKNTHPGMRLRFEMLAEEHYFTQFYMTGLKVEPANPTVLTAIEVDSSLTVECIPGGVKLLSVNDGEVIIFAPDGRRVTSAQLSAGVASTIELAKGFYLIEGHKVIVR